MLMTLIGSSLPNWGLMRYLVPMPVAPFYHGAADQQFWNAFTAMGLPGWLFPVSNMARGTNDPTVTEFYLGRLQGHGVPWSAWIAPVIAWGIFAVALVATLVALARLVTPQWQQNERLPFPIVQVHVALIESPKPGRWLNDLFRSKVLWIALGAVLVIHGMTVLNAYFPRNMPRIPTGYNLTSLFVNEPLSFLRTKVKTSSVSFTVIGVTFFIRSRVAFSLWAPTCSAVWSTCSRG
ncbi:MAG: hypothetical protein QM770_10155 [Tepidisphaeraceae bacterium]